MLDSKQQQDNCAEHEPRSMKASQNEVTAREKTLQDFDKIVAEIGGVELKLCDTLDLAKISETTSSVASVNSSSSDDATKILTKKDSGHLPSVVNEPQHIEKRIKKLKKIVREDEFGEPRFIPVERGSKPLEQRRIQFADATGSILVNVSCDRLLSGL